MLRVIILGRRAAKLNSNVELGLANSTLRRCVVLQAHTQSLSTSPTSKPIASKSMPSKPLIPKATGDAKAMTETSNKMPVTKRPLSKPRLGVDTKPTKTWLEVLLSTTPKQPGEPISEAAEIARTAVIRFAKDNEKTGAKGFPIPDLLQVLKLVAKADKLKTEPSWSPVVNMIVRELMERDVTVSELAQIRSGLVWRAVMAAASQSLVPVLNNKIIKMAEVDSSFVTPAFAVAVLADGAMPLKEWLLMPENIEKLMKAEPDWKTCEVYDMTKALVYSVGASKTKGSAPFARELFKQTIAKGQENPTLSGYPVGYRATYLSSLVNFCKSYEVAFPSDEPLGEDEAMEQLRSKMKLKFAPKSPARYTLMTVRAIATQPSLMLPSLKSGTLNAEDQEFARAVLMEAFPLVGDARSVKSAVNLFVDARTIHDIVVKVIPNDMQTEALGKLLDKAIQYGMNGSVKRTEMIGREVNLLEAKGPLSESLRSKTAAFVEKVVMPIVYPEEQSGKLKLSNVVAARFVLSHIAKDRLVQVAKDAGVAIGSMQESEWDALKPDVVLTLVQLLAINVDAIREMSDVELIRKRLGSSAPKVAQDMHKMFSEDSRAGHLAEFVDSLKKIGVSEDAVASLASVAQTEKGN